MKTTIDLPNDLLRRVKIHAIHENKKMKVVVADFLEKGLHASQSEAKFELPPPVRPRGRPLTIEEIEAAISEGRD